MILQDNYTSWCRSYINKTGDKPFQRNDWWYSPYWSFINKDQGPLNGKENSTDWVADILAKAIADIK